MSKITRQSGKLRIERTALGQVAEYYVYHGEEYIGGGSKREANRLFDKFVRLNLGG